MGKVVLDECRVTENGMDLEERRDLFCREDFCSLIWGILGDFIRKIGRFRGGVLVTFCFFEDNFFLCFLR